MIEPGNDVEILLQQE